MPDNDPSEVVRLITANNPVEAHVWEEALSDEGIEAKVVGDYLDAGIGDISGIQPEVWVHRGDVTRAKEVLSRHGVNEEPEEGEG